MKISLLNALLSIVCAGLFATQAFAISGSDNSSNYTTSTWTNGANGGTGFRPWSLYSNNHGSGFAGLEYNNTVGDANIQVSGSVWKLYAVDFVSTLQQEEAIAYRGFTASLGSPGDTFSVSMEMQNVNGGIGNPGQMGFALRNGNATGSGNQTTGARLAVYLAGGSNYVVVADASGTFTTTVTNSGLGATYDFAVTLTGPNTYSLTITRYTAVGVTAAPVTVAGTLAGSGTIDSFSLFNWKNSTDNGYNSDVYFNKVAYSKVSTGLDNSSNYTTSTWTNGANGGTGFRPWSLYSNNHGSGFAGLEYNNTVGDANIQVSGSVWKLYAVDFVSTLQQEEAIAYRGFTASLGSPGDTFSVSMEMQNVNGGIGNPGQMGFALRNGNATGSGNQTTGARLAVYLAGGSNYVVVADASGTFTTTVTNSGLGATYDFAVMLTGPNTYSLTITRYTAVGVAAAPVTVTGTLAGSGTIDSFSLFNWKNSTDNGYNSDVYFNKLSYFHSSHQDILIDFGMAANTTASPDAFGHYWNNMTNVLLNGGLANLTNIFAGATTVGLTNINVSTLLANNVGPSATDATRLGYFSVPNATIDFFYGNSTTASNAFKITGLSSTNNYSLRFYGARDATTEIRTTRYTIFGGNGTVATNLTTTGSNVGGTGTNFGYTIASVSGITPNGNKEIPIGFATVAGGFSYLNIMEITANQSPVAQPFSLNAMVGQTLSVNVINGTNQPTDPDGDAMTVTAVSGALLGGGTAATNGGTGFTYAASAAGTNQFSYAVSDPYGGIGTNLVTAIISKTLPVLTAPAATAISYGQSLSSSTLSVGAATNSNNNANVPGVFAFTTPSLTPSVAGPTNVSVMFTPTDTTNYYSATTTVTVSVNGTNIFIATSPSVGAISYGQSLASSTLSGGAVTNASGALVPGTFAFTTPSVVPAVGLTNVSVTFTPSVYGYNPVTANVAVSVTKTTPALTPPAASALALGQSLASSILSGGSATNSFNNANVPGTFAFTTPSIQPSLGATNISVTFTPTDSTNYNSTNTTVTVNVSYGSLAFFGTSVMKGYYASGSTDSPNVYINGSFSNSYAALLTTSLLAKGFTATNISQPGHNSTQGTTTDFTNLLAVSPNYVFIGYSLGNDNLGTVTNNPVTVVAKFTTNLNTMISQSRSNGYYPLTVLCYARNDIESAGRYSYMQAMNLVINSWNLPSVNLDGAMDDGTGGLISAINYLGDGGGVHPNDYGHQELFYTIVPTLFDAIAAGKTNSPYLSAVTNYVRLAQNVGVTAPLTFAPSNTMHSFTLSFRVRSTNNGTIAAIHTGSRYATLQITNGQIVYVSTNGSQIVSFINATNGDWHDVALSFRYALTNTWLYVDGVQAGALTEQYAPDQFTLGGPSASGQPASPLVADYQNWCVYRSAWNLGEAQAQMQGNRQQASMEICAALDDASFSSASPASNRAQSLSVAMVNTVNITALQSVTPPSSLTAQSVSGTSVKLAWTKNSTTESGFELERRVTGTTNWSDVVLLAAGSNSYTNSGLTAGVSYDYRVAAVEGGLRGNYSNIATVVPGIGVHQTILVDFGPNDGTNGAITASPDNLGQYWNNLVGAGNSVSIPAGTGINNLITTTNYTTSIGLTISSGFYANGILNGGLLTPSYSLLGNFAIASATEDYFFTGASASLTITNLDSTLNYRLRLFGTRIATDTRITTYTVTGGNGSFTKNLQTSGTNSTTGQPIGSDGVYTGNDSNIVSVVGITPNGSQQITVGVSVATGTFAYLGIMELTANHPPAANVMTVTRTAGLALIISLSDIATNWSDVDGDAVALTGVTMQSTNGVNLAALNWATNLDGSIVTTNAYAYLGYTNSPNVADQISYTIADGFGGTNTGYINIVINNSVTGTNSIVGITTGSTNVVKAYGIPGFNYILERATNLAPAVWIDISTNSAGTNGVINGTDAFTDLGGTPPSAAYYRLKWQP